MHELTAEQQQALRAARALVDIGFPLEQIITNPVIPPHLRQFVREKLEAETSFVLTPTRVVVADQKHCDWLLDIDRYQWHYWPALRQLLLTSRNWETSTLRALDDSSVRILRRLEPPQKEKFDIRGLVLGFVQSGKTANYTALIAKAADAGYRLVIVLSGIDNGLRRQTNIRLKRELVGYSEGKAGAVRLPPIGKQWHEFTREDLNGDFQAGYANHAALQGTQPVLLVVKKNGPVLRRLGRWLDDAPPEVRSKLPFLLIDDEADLASIDTRGTYQQEDGPADAEYEPPSVINGLIRDLLRRFERRAYVAYTATPFANILIPHDTADRRVGNDLYPKDFIVDLPKPPGYFGAEEIFGRMDARDANDDNGLEVIREVTDADIVALEAGHIPSSLEIALLDFVLAGAARAQRGEPNEPVTMLIHTSQRISEHGKLQELVSKCFQELRDGWRYQRNLRLAELRDQWESAIRPVIQNSHPDRDVAFELIEPHIGPFFEAVQIKQINSSTGDVLDYEREPSLKAIAIGGNRLSRGLTLEGLLVSYYIRRSVSYDTLMQMGRWFGYRAGYEDLTRIYTTRELESWFRDLAFVEHQLREDLQVYESQELTPYEVGMRIWQHPTMQVTSPLKRRFTSTTIISQSYALSIVQTFKFPLRETDRLTEQCDHNLASVRNFTAKLDKATANHSDKKGPVWTGVSADLILQFLSSYSVDAAARNIAMNLVCAYIQKLQLKSELTDWTVAVRGREGRDQRLGTVDWGLPDGPISQISRSRIRDTDSVGIITSPGDEMMGLAPDLQLQARQSVAAAEAEGITKAESVAARQVRPPESGLLLLYPISRYSGSEGTRGATRRPLYDNPAGKFARDIVGLAISFPRSEMDQHVEAYLEGTARWKPVE